MNSLSKFASNLRTLSTVAKPKGAVVTNAPLCTRIGVNILEKGGTAVDAAIAAMLGEGVVIPSTMGLGGGFIMTIYNKEKRFVETLDSREVAPKKATEDMFHGSGKLSSRSGLAVAVPGELKGYWEAYKKYGGGVSWEDILQPSIDLCQNGIPIVEFLERKSLKYLHLLLEDDCLREMLIDPKTSRPYRAGHCVRAPKLAETLEQIRDNGVDVLYNGNLTERFVKDIQENGGIITPDDLACYKPEWKTPIKIKLICNNILYTSPLPGGGTILGLILNILSRFLDCSQPSCLLNWHRIVESFKFGFGQRTKLGDPNFENFDSLIADLTSQSYAEEVRKWIDDDKTHSDPSYYGAKIIKSDHGTSNICVLAANGDAVAATSSINFECWGAGFVSKSTGIILNDHMDDFSSPKITSRYNLPPAKTNFIKPGKKPLSSISPSIILDEEGNVRMVIGAAGGPKIITSTALVIVRHLWFKNDIQAAVAEKRLHHQLFPMKITFEDAFKNDVELLELFHKIGHEYQFEPALGFNAVTAITQKNGILDAAFDPRRGGEKIFVF